MVTLSDERIERYSRQILLPRVGGRGQERLLAATVELGGSAEAVAACATWLAGAGVGRIAIPREGGSRSPWEALLLERNPDCDIQSRPAPSPDVVAEIGRIPPDRAGPPSGVRFCFWTAGGEVLSAQFDGTAACRRCLEAIGAPGIVPPAAAILLGTFAAAEILSALLGVRQGAGATLTRLDPSNGGGSAPFPVLSACRTCATR